MLHVIVLALALTPSPSRPLQSECRFAAPRTADIPTSAITTLQVEAGSGNLQVEGRAGLTTIRVRGQACASSRELLEAVTLKTRVNAGVSDVVTDGPDNLRDREYARLDLVIEVPASMKVSINDGSGEASVTGVRSLVIEDGSGELKITDIAESVRVEDGSGEMVISGVGGDVDINDGSGEITLQQIRGSGLIRDGSGSIDAKDITGSVRVSDDGSGSIDVERVGGDFIVTSSSRNGIHHSDVRGEVRIPGRKRR
jgi:hypothetical protein